MGPLPSKCGPVIQVRSHERKALQLEFQETVSSDDDGPSSRGDGGARSRKLLQNPREGVRRNFGSRVFEDVGVVAGLGVGHARPGGGRHVPAEADIVNRKMNW